MSEKNVFSETTQAARIRDLNDRFRREDGNGSYLITAGIEALGDETKAVIIASVRGYDRFNKDTDPYGEHDFGSLEAGGETVFWKIDYYDLALEAHSPDAANETVTHRVLTIMLASEY